MARKSHEPEEAVTKLRQVEVLVNQSKAVAEAIWRGVGTPRSGDRSASTAHP